MKPGKLVVADLFIKVLETAHVVLIDYDSGNQKFMRENYSPKGKHAFS